MARRFAELLFTQAVRAAQTRYGGRADRLLTAADPRDRLGPDEVDAEELRDVVAPLVAEVEQLRAENARLRSDARDTPVRAG